MSSLISWVYLMLPFLSWVYLMSSLISWVYLMSSLIIWVYLMSSLISWVYLMSSLISWVYLMSSLTSWVYLMSFLISWVYRMPFLLDYVDISPSVKSTWLLDVSSSCLTQSISVPLWAFPYEPVGYCGWQSLIRFSGYPCHPGCPGWGFQITRVFHPWKLEDTSYFWLDYWINFVSFCITLQLQCVSALSYWIWHFPLLTFYSFFYKLNICYH